MLFANRKYKSGTIWCFWRWTEVDSEYIVRLHLIKTPWWAVCVHWIKKPDPEPYLHDHPVSFLSIILSGVYCEYRETPGNCTACSNDQRGHPGYMHRWFNFVRATDRHTIHWVAPGTVTLAFMGPKVREWGFHTPAGWVMWKDYYAAQRAAKQ